VVVRTACRVQVAEVAVGWNDGNHDVVYPGDDPSDPIVT